MRLGFSLIGTNRGLAYARTPPVLRPALQSNQSSLCRLYNRKNQGVGGSNSLVVNIKKQLTEDKDTEKSLMKREKKTRSRTVGTPRWTRRVTFFCDRERACHKKKRPSPSSKARWEARQNILMEKARCQTESKVLEKSIATTVSESPAGVC